MLSIRIDNWTAAQLEHMESLGNDVVNAELEASLAIGVKPSSDAPAEVSKLR